MRTILHISDLHFGLVDPAVVGPLVGAAHDARPDLVVVSGDLTQRARAWQFRQARAFLDAFPSPRLVVPGNHDVPLYNVAARFLAPLAGYRRQIARDAEPAYQDAEMVVIGLNSARSATIEDGRLNARQVARLSRVFTEAGDARLKVLVSHHPFTLPPGSDKRLVGGAGRVLEAMGACRADLVLTGHLHTAHAACTAGPGGVLDADRAGSAAPGWSVLLVQAGTATSTRTRGEAGSFNLLRLEAREIRCTAVAWNAARRVFEPREAQRFVRTERGWAHAPGA